MLITRTVIPNQYTYWRDGLSVLGHSFMEGLMSLPNVHVLAPLLALDSTDSDAVFVSRCLVLWADQFLVFFCGSPGSPIVANLYLGEVEKGAPSSITGTAPNRWFRCVDDTGVEIQTKELGALSSHLNNTIKKT